MKNIILETMLGDDIFILTLLTFWRLMSTIVVVPHR